MPNWSGGILTTKGQALQAKVDAGQTTLNLTKMKIGSGVLPNGQSLQSLNDLVAPELIVPISGASANGNITTVTGVITNTGIENGFNVRELGLFAQDPTLGEILYSITIDSAPDYLPPEGGAVTVSEEFSINIVVSNTANVTVTINPSGLITASILEQRVNTHNSDENAHSAAIAKHNNNFTAHAALLRLWQPGKTFVKGDTYRPLTLSYPSWIYLECIQGGVSGANEPVWGAIGSEITDGTVKWRVRDIKNSGGVGIGTVLPFLATHAQPGWLALDTGTEVSRATYPDLWAWVQENAPLITEAAWQAQAAVQTSVGAYSSGDGSTTFRLPRIVDFVRGSDGVRLPGTWQADAVGPLLVQTTATNGSSMNHVTANPYLAKGDSGSNLAAFTLSANTETHPKSVSMLYCVKAFDAPSNQGMVDLTALANEVAGKQKSIKTAIINETQPSGTNGGTFTAGAYRTRTLNTILRDDIGITLSSNQITLPAGIYLVSSPVGAYAVGEHKAVLKNISDGTEDIKGCVATASSTYGGFSHSVIDGLLVLASQKTFEVQHICNVTNASVGFGRPISSGSPEIYTTIKIQKVG